MNSLAILATLFDGVRLIELILIAGLSRFTLACSALRCSGLSAASGKVGDMNSLEWNGGMEQWNGLLDWSTGAVAFTQFTLTGGTIKIDHAH